MIFLQFQHLQAKNRLKILLKNTGWEVINIIKVRNKIRVPQQMSGNQNLAGLYPEVFEQRTIHAWTFHKTKSLPSYKMAFSSKISGFRPLNPIDDKIDIIFMIIEPILSILLSIFCLPLNREGPNCWLNSFVSFLISKQILSPGLKSLKDAYNYRFCYCLLSAVGLILQARINLQKLSCLSSYLLWQIFSKLREQVFELFFVQGYRFDLLYSLFPQHSSKTYDNSSELLDMPILSWLIFEDL